jgi:hypothetical protein
MDPQWLIIVTAIAIAIAIVAATSSSNEAAQGIKEKYDKLTVKVGDTSIIGTREWAKLIDVCGDLTLEGGGH